MVCFFASCFLHAQSFSKGFPSEDSAWPTLWVQDSARIRPLETAALKWWQNLETGQSSQKWSREHLDQSLYPWQIWLGIYLCDLKERQTLKILKLDPELAQSLNLDPNQLYSYVEIESARQTSPTWKFFAQKIVNQAFNEQQTNTSRFQTSSKRSLVEIDGSLIVYADGQKLKLAQQASHPFLADLPSTIEKESPEKGSKQLLAWQHFVARCSLSALLPHTSMKIPLFIDSAKSFRWHDPKDILLSDKSILGLSQQDKQKLIELWKNDPPQAWDRLALHIKKSQSYLEKDSNQLPSKLQNTLERLYYKIPLLMLTTLLYLLASIASYFGLSALFSLLSISGWVLHSLLLLFRILILLRPPVANMEETTLYVPWVAITVILCLEHFFKRSHKPFASIYLISASLLAGSIIFIPETSMEVIPAVLNSQLWLTIHVLMVVGSYAFFLIASALSHSQLLNIWKGQKAQLTSLVVGSMAVGTLLLTCGTLLGAVWAAQSWGRFWDWDPKESWAFISCCLYLLIFHAWAFKKISAESLHLLSIAGFWVISFTWYGVNFLIATGLHSYGFGASPYTSLYLTFLLVDALILSVVFFRVLSISPKWDTKE